MKLKNIITATLFLISFSFLFTACKKETGVELNDEEIITDVVLTFVNQTTGDSLHFTYQDSDGPGGLFPTQDSILLQSNTNYKLILNLYNKTQNPIVDISGEIKEEATAHRFYYFPSANCGISIYTTDTDENGVPLGLQSTVTTTNNNNGNLTIILRHYPGNPPDKAIADLENSPKSTTDVDITFDLRVQ